MGDLVYPKGRIAMGGSDLFDVTNVTFQRTNGAKQVHTLRRKGAGITWGVDESNVSFDMAISEEGLERDFVTAMAEGVISQLIIKIPGTTYTVEGAFTDDSQDLPLDDAIKASLSFVGATTTS